MGWAVRVRFAKGFDWSSSIGAVSFELWYACVMRVAQQAVTESVRLGEIEEALGQIWQVFFPVSVWACLSYRDFDRDGDDEIGKFEVKVSQIIKDKKVTAQCLFRCLVLFAAI